MSEHAEILVQRFLDGELSHGERRSLLRLLGDRADLRQRLLADETLLDVAANLPRPTPRADFVESTLARLPQQEPAGTEPAMEAHRRPVVRWLAAAATAASLLLASGFWLGRVSAPPIPATEAVAPPVDAEVLVRLVLIEPAARSVAIVGDFNGWDPGQSPLERRDNGLWSTTLALPPGRYHYMFLVDGSEWLADPLAGETSLDGFGAQNSVLTVEV
jgi:hypothetical protein